jgi:hypothetical protein
MISVLNWSRFENGQVSPERAFEAFSAQLFERWLRRPGGLRLNCYVLEGAGGDGGVEAFATLPDGTIHGLQAKWFPDNLNDSRVRQIRASLDTAIKQHPGLRRYVVAMPKNLTKGRRGLKGKSTKGGVERWSEFVEGVKRDYPGVEVVRWDEAGLLEQLAEPGNQELKALWFSEVLTHDHIVRAWKKAQRLLQDRYIPVLHAMGEVDRALAYDLWTYDALKATRASLTEACGQIEAAQGDLHGFVQLSKGQRPADLEVAIQPACEALIQLAAHAHSLLAIISSEPTREIPPRPLDESLRIFESCVRIFKESRQGTYLVELAERAVDSATSASKRILTADTALRESAASRLICGPPGCGKTHSAARTVEAIVKKGGVAVLVLAKDYSPSQGPRAILERALDVPGWPLQRILDGLEALAVLKQLNGADGGRSFVRSLLLIDGLEESPNSDQWASALAELVVEARDRPRVHLAATARHEYVKLITIPDGICTKVVEEHSEVDLPKLFQAYAHHYKVNVDEVPWLGWVKRTPLEIRLFTEVFQGRTVDATDAARSNLLTLFRSKLVRLEDEARRRAGNAAWSANISLISRVLEEVATLLVQAKATRVEDSAVIEAMEQYDREFTASRVRSALELLREHGLVDRWIPPSPPHTLVYSKPAYGLATRHVSDFILASQLNEQTMETLRAGKKPNYPPVLRRRDLAAVLYAAMLAENGHHVVDLEWGVHPNNTASLHAAALSLLPQKMTISRVAELQAWLVESTARNRDVLQRLVIPVARVPNHPLGPRILDQALRQMPMHERDMFWSVPEDLDGTGPWQRCSNLVLDTIKLEPSIDRWDGLPLLAAWTCSSVVEARRRRAREMLAEWGAAQLAEMVKLLEHMAGVDDPQVVDDMVIAALGAAAGAAANDGALSELAKLVDRLFFAKDATCWTTSVPVRFGARGIVERAALVYPGEFDAELDRARPPYQPRGEWPKIDWREVAEDSPDGGQLVTQDLHWYVADKCFELFADKSPTIRNRESRQIDHRLMAAVEAGEIDAPPAIKDRQTKPQEAAERMRQIGIDKALQRFTLLSSLSDDELTNCNQTQSEFPSPEDEDDTEAPPSPKHSIPFQAFLSQASSASANDAPSPEALRNGMIAHLVRSWGWSEERFSKYDWQNPPSVVDDAITRRHGPAARHFERSTVARFREKYVWAAIDRIAGALADRLPVWSKEADNWGLLRNIEQVGISIADPLPGPNSGDAPSAEQFAPWSPPEVLVDQFGDISGLAERAEAWLTKGKYPDPKTIVRDAVEHWPDAAVLALSLFRRGHQCCIDQTVQLRAFAVDTKYIELIRRDAAYTFADVRDHGSCIADGGYTSPAVACWAPWMTWSWQDKGYNSFDAEGAVTRVRLDAMVGEITARFEGEWPREQRVWMPGPGLKEALGIMGMRGGRWHRSYVDRDGVVQAVERNGPPTSHSFDHHYLAVDWERYEAFLRTNGLVPVWVVRIRREANSALYKQGNKIVVPDGLKHRYGHAIWLVIDPSVNAEVDVVQLTTALEPFTSPTRSGGT